MSKFSSSPNAVLGRHGGQGMWREGMGICTLLELPALSHFVSFVPSALLELVEVYRGVSGRAEEVKGEGVSRAGFTLTAGWKVPLLLLHLLH